VEKKRKKRRIGKEERINDTGKAKEREGEKKEKECEAPYPHFWHGGLLKPKAPNFILKCTPNAANYVRSLSWSILNHFVAFHNLNVPRSPKSQKSLKPRIFGLQGH